MKRDDSGAADVSRPERMFLAVDLAAESRAELQEALRGTELPGRPVAPRNWHLTLRFLGDTQPSVRDRLREELRARELGPSFELTLAGAGAFPRRARATTLWIGTAGGEEELASLAATAEHSARAAGFAAESRPFRAHLTLSRLRSPEDVRPLLRELGGLRIRTPVRELVLFRSQLGAGPPRYQAVERFPLGSPPAELWHAAGNG